MTQKVYENDTKWPLNYSVSRSYIETFQNYGDLLELVLIYIIN